MPEFPLLPLPAFEPGDPPPSYGFPSQSLTLSTARQRQRLGPKFERLESVLASSDGLSLRNDPSSIAPERALVLEVLGSAVDFQKLAWNTDGLEFLAEEDAEFEPDADFYERDARKGREGERRDDRPLRGLLYLAMPDVHALRELLSLWNRWQREKSLPNGKKQWRHVFERLRDLRPWGLADRIADDAIAFWKEEVASDPMGMRRIEVELWFYRDAKRRQTAHDNLVQALTEANGDLVDYQEIGSIRYQAALIDCPGAELARLAAREEVHLAVCDDVMLLRPQSSVRVAKTGDPARPKFAAPVTPISDLPPVAALLDGVPVQGHRLLAGRIDVDDPDELDAMSLVSERRHGTAMASLVLHGDRNDAEKRALGRRLHVRPVLYAPAAGEEQPRPDRLLVDVIYQAIMRMKEGDGDNGPTAPEVFLVNLSLGDPRRPFSGSISPWGRLLDYLADQYGILFLVSAGNITRSLSLSAFSGWMAFEEALPGTREEAVLDALFQQKAYRTLLSPAEALNAVTVGASHDDAFDGHRGASAMDPYIGKELPNMSSALGLGHRKVIKPDIHMPGGREHVRPRKIGEALAVSPAGHYGLLAAAPDSGGNLKNERLIGGTSAAAAMATRAAHRLFDALMDAAGGSMHADLEPQFYAVVIKALLVHRSTWGSCADLLDGLYGPHGQGKHVERRDNIARLLGYGIPHVEEAIACASNRATFVGCGTIAAKEANVHQIPLPSSLDGQREPRTLTVTVAWFSPVNPGHSGYRMAKLEVDAVNKFEAAAGVKRRPEQPSDKSVPRGTVFHTRYHGEKAAPFIDDGHVLLRVYCRELAGRLDKPIRYGVAVSIEAGEGIPVYEEVRAKLAVLVAPVP